MVNIKIIRNKRIKNRLRKKKKSNVIYKGVNQNCDMDLDFYL